MPKLTPMPTSQQEVQIEAIKLGLLGPNAGKSPSKNEYKRKRTELLKYCYASSQVGRCMTDVSAILLGNSGAGKSSTLNHLLGSPVAAVSATESETKATTGLKLETAYAPLAVSNLSLTIVDTPGFNDTCGHEQDACNLYSIAKYRKTARSLKGAYPNVVLLLLQATDIRFVGEQSNFSKCIRGIEKLELVDPEHPNVVFTNACSVPGKGVKWRDTLDAKGTQVNDIIAKSFGFRAPVVYIENKFEDHELEMTGEKKEYSRLPDGSIQPKNLFKAITDMLVTNEDALAIEAFKAFFVSPDNMNPTCADEVKAADYKKAGFNHEEKEIHADMQEAGRSSNKTEVESWIRDYLEKNSAHITQVSIHCPIRLRSPRQVTYVGRLFEF